MPENARMEQPIGLKSSEPGSRGKPRNRRLTGRLPFLGRTPSAEKVDGLRRRSLAHAQRAFWEKIVPGAVERAEKGNATSLRFLLAVVRDPTLRRDSRPAPPRKSAQERVEELMRAERLRRGVPEGNS